MDIEWEYSGEMKLMNDEREKESDYVSVEWEERYKARKT